MTTQQQIKALLEKTGIPAKEIQCYGSQIVITAHCRKSAEKWATVVAKFATVKAVKESMDYCKVNRNTVMLPSAVKVWRVWGTI